MTVTTHRAKTGRKQVDIEQRRREVEDLLAALREWEAEQSPEYIAKVLAQWDGYSENNAKLIAMQDPHATDVDSIRAWRQRGTQEGGPGYAVMPLQWEAREQYAIKIVRPVMHTEWRPDPDDPAKKIPVSVVDYYYVWRGLYDFRHVVLNEQDVICKWNADHPTGQW